MAFTTIWPERAGSQKKKQAAWTLLYKKNLIDGKEEILYNKLKITLGKKEQ